MAGLARMLKSTTTDLADTPIPQLRDDPAYAEAAALLVAFRDQLALIERDRLIVDFEQHLAGRAPESDGEANAQIRVRLAGLRAAAQGSAPAPVAPKSNAAAPSAAVAAGLAVLAGESVPVPPDHAARVGKLDRDHAAIRAAITAQTDVVDQLAGELTLRYATELRPAWDALQLEMYRAAQELSRSAARVRDFRAAIVAAGIGSRSDVLAMPNIRSPLILGSESQYDSEISGWRRILETQGILK
ncbi:MAG TPA: hypothetical protein VNF49_13465 [Candidatus Binataceae bacterium]|nr:hypothetical protein [Candidatus Binataceae bacterium]